MVQEAADWLCGDENGWNTWQVVAAACMVWFGLSTKTADRNTILPAVVVDMIGFMMSYSQVTDILNLFIIFTLGPEK
jgi:hypothetical protein